MRIAGREIGSCLCGFVFAFRKVAPELFLRCVRPGPDCAPGYGDQKECS